MTTRSTGQQSTMAVLAFSIALVCLTSSQCLAGSKVFIGTKSSKRVSLDKIDHSSWDRLLQKYVDHNGLVDYRSWKANQADAKALDSYLAHLSSASRSVNATHEARLAFWINAYNAVSRSDRQKKITGPDPS